MKLRLFCTLAVVAFAASVQALDTSNCKSNPQDPFSPDARMAYGKYKGQCIDTSQKRAVQFLEDFTGETTIANFRYKGKFYMAHIPAQGVRQISYMIVDLDPSKSFLVSHTQLRFRMHQSTPIRLFPQYGNSQQKVAEIHDFIVSYNYMAPAGVPYEPAKGLNKGLYSSALQMYATEDEINTRIKAKRNMYEVRLSFYGNEQDTILKNVIERSDRLQYSDAYDTWTNNCTTQLFDILDASIPGNKGIKPFRFSARKINDTGLLPAISALDKRNLLSIDAEVKLVNTEFNYPLFPSKNNSYLSKFKGKILPQILKIED